MVSVKRLGLLVFLIIVIFLVIYLVSVLIGGILIYVKNRLEDIDDAMYKRNDVDYSEQQVEEDESIGEVSTFISIMEDDFIDADDNIDIYADKITKCCYYFNYREDKIMSPVYKSDGTIYTIDELEPLLNSFYGEN